MSVRDGRRVLKAKLKATFFGLYVLDGRFRFITANERRTLKDQMDRVCAIVRRSRWL